MTLFKSFNIPDWLKERLHSLKYIEATPIQQLVIPQALKNKSLVVRSETGSGKTHSFLVPMVSNINTNLDELQGLIIAPTKELAAQIYDFLTKIIKNTEIRAKLVSSSLNEERSVKNIKQKPHIIVGTIGKLHDLFIDESYVSTKYIKTLVLDEADMLLEQGFADLIDSFMEKLDKPQILVFSATINQSLQYILEKYIQSDFVITSDSDNMTSKNVKHYALDIKHREINVALDKFIASKPCFCMMIFCSKKELVVPIYSHLKENGLSVAYITGDLSKQERKNVIKAVNLMKYQYVVCSDLASRGLDIQNIDVVLSIDIPNNIEYYFHRAGRTGRFDKFGESYVFYNADTQNSVRKLLSNGLKMEFIKFGDGNTFVETKPIDYKKVYKSTAKDELNKEIHRIRSSGSKKVKPGYKKKMEQEVNKAKSRFRREIIKKDIRRQREERYKKEARNAR